MNAWVLGHVERPDKGEDQAWQVAGCGLLDDQAADLTVDAAERRGAVVEVAQREPDGDVVVEQPQAGWSGLVQGWTVGQPDR